MSITEQHRFVWRLTRVSRSWRGEMDRRLGELGLSQARWLVLLHLARFLEDYPTQRELARSLGIEGPTLARLLDSLESQGLVRRFPVPEDRRAKKVALCERAWPLIQQIEAISEQLRNEVFAGIDPEELQRCERVHEQMLQNLTK